MILRGLSARDGVMNVMPDFASHINQTIPNTHTHTASTAARGQLATRSHRAIFSHQYKRHIKPTIIT
jgi:hypothetical protein